MKLNVGFLLYPKWVLNPADFCWFVERYPDALNPDSGGLFLYIRDALHSPVYHEWDQKLGALGMKPMPDSLCKFMEDCPERCRGYYFRQATRHYTPSECSRSEYVGFFLQATLLEGCEETAPGEFRIDMDDVANEVDTETAQAFRKGRLHFFSLENDFLGVSDEGKQLLEASGLSGFKITRPLPVIGDDAESIEGHHWHVDITTTLPLSPKIRWRGPDGTPYTGQWMPDAMLADDGLLALDRAALEQAGRPDLAMRERYGEELRVPQNRPVGSQRWFQFCKANKIRCDWTPLEVLG